MKKKILAVALAATMVVASAFNAFAADSLVGSGWWTDCQTSTAQTIADGDTVTFSVTVNSNDSVADGDYAAFCVEATDGTNYFTGTSDGDCWGAGTDVDPQNSDGTYTSAVVGSSYTVTITRSGNDWEADIFDSTGASTLSAPMQLTGTSDFGDTTCYIMTQVGDLTVDVVTASTDDTDDATEAASDDDATDAASDDATDAASDDDATTTTTAASTTETGDVTTFAAIAIVVAAAAAIVVLKKRVTE